MNLEATRFLKPCPTPKRIVIKFITGEASLSPNTVTKKITFFKI